MSKQEAVDAHINTFEGKWIFDNQESAWLTDDWKITKEEFTRRAKELGWINGYQWGKEYPTNGKKPDLPDDVLVEVKFDPADSVWHQDTVDNWRWLVDGMVQFRIVDERYKPKETPMSEQLGNSEQLDNSWFDRGEFPPVGAECEVLNSALDNAEWENCIIKFIGELVCVYTSDSCNERCAYLDFIKFRPIKSERERFVDAALKAVAVGNLSRTKEVAEALFNAGFRAPS